MSRSILGVLFLAAIIVAFAAPLDRAAAEGDMSGDWSVTSSASPSVPPKTCPAFVSQEGNALALGQSCENGAASVLRGSFEKPGSTFELSGYQNGKLFLEVEGVLSGDRTTFDGLWRAFEKDQQISAGGIEGVRAQHDWGDADCSSSPGSVDALLVLQSVVNASVPLPCGHLADVLLDTVLDPADALLILQAEVGLIDRLPVLPDG